MARPPFFRIARAFSRGEDGVAFITFGMFIGILLILLCAAGIDFLRDHYNDAEDDQKTQEYSTLLTQEYSELWLKRASCVNNGQTLGCSVNADKNSKVFAKNLNVYAYGGNGQDPVAIQDMQAYLDRAFNNDIGSFRFQKSQVPEVAIVCDANTNRLLLTFTTTSPSFNTFWKVKSELKSVVKRLSNVPCDFADPRVTACIGSQCSATPEIGPGAGTCQHGKKTRLESDPTLESAEYYSSIDKNRVNLGTANSVVNFIVSLDAESKRALGGTSNSPTAPDNYISRFAGSLLNDSGTLGDKTKIGTGMTIGNYPMRGGGAPICTENQSNLQYSGSCYDASADFSGIQRNGPADSAMDSAGLGNTNRKLPFTGEFRAQYTRHCPNSEARWTYSAEKARDCREEFYAADDHTFNHTVSDDPRLATPAGRQAMADEQYAAAGGDGYCPGQPDDVDTLGYDIDSNTPVPNNCGLTAADVAGNGVNPPKYCYRFKIRCIKHVPRDYSVMRGHWYASCRSQTLGADPAAFYGEPSDYVDFRGKLAADLDLTQPIAQHNKVELIADIQKSARPNELKASDGAVLHQLSELSDLHVKNTERSFYWACEQGPTDSANGRPAANDGNLGAPQGIRTLDTGKELLKNDGSQTSYAQNLVIDKNGNRGCEIPILGSPVQGKMTGTVNTYDLTFHRKDCTGPECGIPEALYALTIKPKNPLQTVVTPDEAKRLPDRALKTSWRPSAGVPDQQRYGDGTMRWAWQEIGTVTGGGGECPLATDIAASSNCYDPLVGMNSGQKYCGYKVYNTTYYSATAPANRADCNTDGSGCPNIARYIDAGGDVIQRDMMPERLNIGTVSMERRTVPNIAGQPTPYTCTFDKGETTTSSRSGIVQVAGGPSNTNPDCNWALANNNLFCQKNSPLPIPVDQVEENFIDDNASGSVTGGGIFSLTAANFARDLVLGDDTEEFGTQTQKTNFKVRKITRGKLASKDDPRITIMPASIQTEEVVRYHNSDLGPDNMEILNTANQFTNVVREIAKGYAPYDILPYHNGNQCALFKQGLRSLWRNIDTSNATGSKFAVFIGALPTAADYRASIQGPHLSNGKPSASPAPGDYVPAEMKLKSVASVPPSIFASVSPGSDIIRNCFKSADTDASTTPFLVTTLGATATTSEVNDTLDALEEATALTTNESCKRPFCLLSATDGKFGTITGQNIMTPETCAAKLWKCISPAATKF